VKKRFSSYFNVQTTGAVRSDATGTPWNERRKAAPFSFARSKDRHLAALADAPGWQVFAGISGNSREGGEFFGILLFAGGGGRSNIATDTAFRIRRGDPV